MNKTRVLHKTLIAIVTSFTVQQTFAAGFQLNAQSATGLGRAFAGDAVIADNASVIARNPAAMALFDKMSLSLGIETITTLIDGKNGQYCGFSCQNASGSTESANYTDAGGTSAVPNIYLIVPVDHQFAWGVSAYSNFGTKTQFDKGYTASEYGGLTDVKSFNLGVSGSYRIDTQWSLGAGLDVVYGKGRLHRTFSPSVTAVVGTNQALDVDADGWALGFNLGTVYELDKHNRFGLDYHYSPEIKTKGDINYAGYTAVNGKISDTLPLNLPDFAEFSGYHRLNDLFAVHYSIQWIQWSEFTHLEADTSGELKQYNWKNSWHYSVGGTYYLNPTWTFRAGYMYDTSAQDETRSISVPDSDRQWFSTGFTYQFDEKSNVDFGVTYLLGKDVHVEESTSSSSGTALSSVNATTHADAVMVGLQYSRTF